MEKLEKQIKDLRLEVKSILDTAKGEERDPTSEEVKRMAEIGGEVKALEEKVAIEAISVSNNAALAHLMAPANMGAGNFSAVQPEMKEFLKEAADSSTKKSHVNLRTSISTKSFSSEYNAGAGSYNARIENGVQQFGNVQVAPKVLDYFNIVPTDAGTIRVASLTAFTNDAAAHHPAATASGTSDKAESDFTWIGKDQIVATVAHWVKASRDILSDSNRLQAFVGQKLLQGAMTKATNYLFTGDDSNAGQFDGFDNYSVLTQATTGVTNINRVALGIAQLGNAPDGNHYIPNAIFMNPTDWANMQISQSASGYLLGTPGSNLGNTLWGVPVVTHGAVPTGYAYVGDFSQWDLYQRDEMEVFVTDSDAEDFKKNIITILGEVRMTLGTMYPSSVCKVTLS